MIVNDADEGKVKFYRNLMLFSTYHRSHVDEPSEDVYCTP